MIPVTGLHHAVLFVRRLQRSIDFYTATFGFEVVAQSPGQMAFLRAAGSTRHHDLGLIAVGDHAPARLPGAVGLYHLAWEVPDLNALATAMQQLKAQGAFIGASDHGATKSVYGQDPDGHEFEIVWQVPPAEWGEFAHQAVTRSLNLPQELERFGDQRSLV